MSSIRQALPLSMRIDLAELETFIAVAQLGSFSLAAQHLHITQPSVTSRIQRLEAVLDTKLLIRTTRTVQTTPQGALLLREATQVLHGLQSLVENFHQQAQASRSRVAVAATPMLAAEVLPLIIHSYCQKYTDVQIELRDLRYRDALNALLSGEADVAVLALQEHDRRFRFQPVREDDMVLVVPSDHALAHASSVSPDAMAAYPLVVLQHYEPMLARIAEDIGRRGLALPPAQTAGNLNTIIGMLDARLGMTLLPRSMTRRPRQEGHVVVEIEGIRLSRSFGIATLRNAALSSTVQSFCRYLQQAFPEASSLG
ncbi:LysR family transcriptional regulator [Candidimonas humi]|uniref:LysR family transcriptional regulator n=1 Tax=Candidimonas humi TaxID=683355 RepID=A0ABV8NWL5_9BURK|nr:LysR family transcriptional regulator [Candidimonas humi]MBV6303325.1 LysR family transcriptional regulator [Candidimonas humi]